MRSEYNNHKHPEVARKSNETRNKTLRSNPEIMKIVSEKKKKWYEDHPEYLKELSHFMSGENNPAKRPEVKKKISDSITAWHKEQPTPKEPELISMVCDYCKKTMFKRPCDIIVPKRHFCSNECRTKGISNKLESNPNWKGGISFEPYCPKFNNNLKERVRSFFDYECVLCNKTTRENGEQLAVHHVEYDKQACCDGELVHFVALCRSCHSRTNNNRLVWEHIFHRIIDELYNGRSYYTKEEYKYYIL